MKLVGELILRDQLTRSDCGAMLALMYRHYTNVRPDVFLRDLADKHWVIVIRAVGTGKLCGFSTQTLLEVEHRDQTIRALFSGDTIVDREHWGDPALSHVWGRLALSLIERHGDEPLYWFLLSQGFRTYRFLPLFFHEFYPRYDAPTPDEIRQTLDALARRRYGSRYNRTSGVIASDPHQYALREGVGDVTSQRLLNRHVEFFQRVNPGHGRGDELCCIAPLSRENFTSAAYRVIGPEPVVQVLG